MLHDFLTKPDGVAVDYSHRPTTHNAYYSDDQNMTAALLQAALATELR
ncbi:MAG: hypothetical protein GY949_08970 [Gammaproteobacteria bacterium]|nr:hypothetical protein [Gammaproteobacteria bacterium]